MERLQRKLAEVETGLSDPELYQSADGGLQSLIRDQTELKEQLDTLEGEWLDMQTELESL